MFKRKKILIAMLALIMMLAMSVTAFAATKKCSITSAQTGSAYTGSLTCKEATHCSGYNSTSSTNKMVLELQWQQLYGSWDPCVTRFVLAGQYVSCSPIDLSAAPLPGINHRTMITSYLHSGGVDGTGNVYDY